MSRSAPAVSTRAEWRLVGGRNIFFRSGWEANYARFLEYMRCRGEIVAWEHEPKTFWFPGVRRGAVSYLPDFKVTKPCGLEEYHEVKGWMDSRSKTKLRRMRKYFPKVIVIVIDAEAYRRLAAWWGRIVPGWE